MGFYSSDSETEKEEEEEEGLTPQTSVAQPSLLPPKLSSGRFFPLGEKASPACCGEVFEPFEFSGGRFVISSLAQGLVARVEQVFEQQMPPRLMQIWSANKEDRLVSATACSSNGRLALGWQNRIEIYLPAADGSGEMDFLLLGPQWRLVRTLLPKEPSKLLGMHMSTSLLALGFEKSIQVWNLDLGELVFASLDFGATQVQFSPDGRLLTTMGSSGVRIWYRNKNANDLLSHVTLSTSIMGMGSKIEWRNTRVQASNTLLIVSANTTAEVFQESDFQEDLGFYQLFRLDFVVPPTYVGWLSAVDDEDRKSRCRLIWNDDKAKLSTTPFAEMDVYRAHHRIANWKCVADFLLCLDANELKRYAFQGLGQSPRVAVSCQVDWQQSFSGHTLDQVKACFLLPPNDKRLFGFVQDNGICKLVDLTCPNKWPKSAAKVRFIHFSHNRQGLMLVQDELNHLALWGSQQQQIVWEKPYAEPLELAAISSSGLEMVLISKLGRELVFTVTRKCTLFPPSEELVNVQLWPEAVLVGLPKVGDSRALVFQSLDNGQELHRICLDVDITCFAGQRMDSVWIGTQSNGIYFNNVLYFPIGQQPIAKLEFEGIWLCALMNGKVHLGTLGSKSMQQLDLINVLDISLCKITENSYSLLVLQYDGLVSVFAPLDSHHHQQWRLIVNIRVPLPCLDKVQWLGTRMVVFSSLLGLIWEISGELISPSPGAHVHSLCWQQELPEFHPKILMELFRLGDFNRVEVILKHVLTCLQESESVQTGGTVDISPTPPPTAPPEDDEHLETAFSMWSSTEVQKKQKNEDWLDELEHLLPTKRLTGLSSNELLLVLNICNLFRKLTQTQNFKALDLAGSRFALAVENHKLAKTHNRIRTSEVIWALHSTTQANLIQLFVNQGMQWDEDLASIGVGYWMENMSDCVTMFERLAKAAHVRNPKEPFDSLLFYCTLNKPKVSSALFKLAGKAKLATLLAMDFVSKEEARIIAVKNAYACMEKKMFKEAAAFFILGHKVKEALRVLARNLGDCQLALIVGRILQARECTEQIITEFTWEIGLATRDPFLCAIAQTLLKRSGNEICNCFQITTTPPVASTIWMTEFAAKHEAIEVGRSDPLMSVLFLRWLKQPLNLEQECGVYYLKQHMPTIASMFITPTSNLNALEIPSVNVLDALYYGKSRFQLGVRFPLKSTMEEEVVLALLQLDFSKLIRLLFDKTPLETAMMGGFNEWPQIFCSRVLVLLVLEHVMEEDVDGAFRAAVLETVDLCLGNLQRGIGLPILSSLTLNQLVQGLVQFCFPNPVQHELWELVNGPKEMERFVLAVAVQRRRQQQAIGQIAEINTTKQPTTYTLFSKPGLGLNSLGLMNNDCILVLGSSRQGLREFNIHSSLAFRARTEDGCGVVDLERDSFYGMQSRFQLQERANNSGQVVETWEELLLSRSVLGTKPIVGTASGSIGSTVGTQHNQPRGDRDRAVSSKLAMRPNSSTYISCGQDGEALIWTVGAEIPTAALPSFSQHPMIMVKYNPTGSFLLGVDTTGSCALYSNQDAFFHTMPFKPSSVTDVTFLSNTVFATTNIEGKISVFDSLLPPKSCMVASWHHPRLEDGKAAALSSPSSSSSLTKLVYSADLDCLITGSSRGLLFAVDMRKCIAIQNCLVSNKPITSLALSSDAGKLACGTADGAVLLWQVGGSGELLGKPQAILPSLHLGQPHVSKPTFFKAASQMNLIANSTPAPATQFNHLANVVSDVEFATDNSSVFSCGSDGTVKLSFFNPN
ncbi:hypothetical protein BASA81_011123 [Batrachochytrium salamandrivorans]|nr:hypothetical protein BASA81_011123 [Batrachochytrium salamandrivorans]